MKLSIIALCLFIILAGCGSIRAVGFWMEHDDPRRSFSLQMQRDTDPEFEPPTIPRKWNGGRL